MKAKIIRPFHTDFKIRLTFGESFNPEGKTSRVYLCCFNSMNKGEIYRVKVPLTKVSRNVYELTFKGRDQKYLGDYFIIIQLNPLRDGQQEKTVWDAFHLTLRYDGSYAPVDLVVSLDLASDSELRIVEFEDVLTLASGDVYFIDVDSSEEGQVYFMNN